MPRGPSEPSLSYWLEITEPSHRAVWDGRRDPDAPASLLVTRSRSEHARLRVSWTHAFSAASVRDYHPAIIKRASQLANELEKRALAGETVNLVTYMSFFACVLFFFG